MQHLRRVLVALALTLGLLPVLSIGSAGAAPIDNSNCSQWVRIVDVSSYQGTAINWGLVARDGVAGVYVKATQGTSYVSPAFASQIAGAKSVGLPWGAYDYAQPGQTNPVTDAQFFVSAGGAAGTLPPVLDLETSATNEGLTVLWAQWWSAEIKALTGRTPITIYTGAYYPWSSDPALAALGPAWISAYPDGYSPVPNGSACGLYPPSTGAWSGWSVWQYSSVQSIWGIPGNVDIDVATPQWWAVATGATVAPPNSPGTNNRYPAPTYTLGSSGTAVIQIQTILTAAGLFHSTIDGQYGPITAAAVAQWQQRLNVSPADGIWGPATQNATNNLFTFLAALSKAHTPKPKPVSPAVLKAIAFVHACSTQQLAFGSKGPCVTFAQQRLQAKGWPIAADGVFGVTTQTATKNFKRTSMHQRNPVGIITTATWKALLAS